MIIGDTTTPALVLPVGSAFVTPAAPSAQWSVVGKPRGKAPKPTPHSETALAEAEKAARGAAMLAAMRIPAPRPRGVPRAPDEKVGEKLADELDSVLKRYILMGEAGCTVCVLWCMHTYLYEACLWTPYLMVTSPVYGCGKSTLRKILEEIAHRGIYTNSPSAAFVYRLVDAARPSLMIDEWDALAPEVREAFTAILNSGTDYKGNIGKCNPVTLAPEVFRTYCPKAIFGIGGTRLPAATQSRIIDVVLQRAVPEDQIARLRGYEAPELCKRLEEWSKTVWDWSVGHEPAMFKSPTLRSRDVWEPLFTVATACGPKWLARAREAMGEVITNEELPAPEAIKLLEAVAHAFSVRGEQFMSGTDLVGDDEVRLKAKSPHALATKLRLFGVRPSLRRLADKVVRCYSAEDLKVPLARYVTHPPPPL